MSRRGRSPAREPADEEEGVELAQDPVQRRGRGRPSRRKPDGDGGSDSDDSVPPAADEEEPPADGEEGGGGGGGGKKFKGNGSSSLWSSDTAAQEAALEARYKTIRPLVPPVVRKKYTLQQEIMRGLACLSFGLVCISFEVLCVQDLACFDVSDDPGVLYMWDFLTVPIMLVVGCICVPWCLALVETDNLDVLRAGTGMQFLTAVILSITGGMAYGHADDLYGFQKIVRKIWENNGEEIHNGDPYSADNQVLPQEALFYYEMVVPGEGGARAPYELWLADPDADLAPNQATFEEMLDADPLAERLNTVMWHYFAFGIGGGVLFLAQFSISMSYLCHVYYGPDAANRRAGNNGGD
ncbi:hypothetical protein TeGR_g3607 [Tetraparma gracilis]|uniref:Transmembrane protein n=1 Tax=Tetraparma gracilis TaxID=2962635 RepID=A0ABQ6MRT1_9STRA|nr:hypothetical protein TeGR_g3607 [Tetraparma gracilis]